MNREPRRERRALSHVGGPTELSGDREAATILARSLDVHVDEAASRAHVHGFHSYPARIHPHVARGLVASFSAEGADVLDPFCGSGTVLVESRLLGRAAHGVDLNPLAARLSELKANGRNEKARVELLAAATRAAAVATTRRERRAGASKRYEPIDVEAFAPHVLLELDGLRVGIVSERDDHVRADLELVLSAILTKVSRKAGDSSEGRLEKRIAPGFVSRFFVDKTRELVERLAEYERLLPKKTPRPDVFEGDARDLRHLRARGIELVVTSPPYPGNYDYLRHHDMRLRWLGLDERGLSENEIGARRHLERDPRGTPKAAWERSLVDVLRAIERVLTEQGVAVLVLADSVVSRRPFYNDDFVREAAPRASLSVVASASQPRPHFHLPSRDAFRLRPRREHAMLLELAKRR